MTRDSLLALSAPPAPPAACALFIGVPTLEGFADLADTARPVYAAKLVEPGRSSGPGPVRSHSLVVLVQQVSPAGHVLYCRLPAARLDTLYGEPANPDVRDREQAWEGLWNLALHYLQETGGFTLAPACVAVPKDLVLLDGEFKAVRYDRESRSYVPRQQPENGKTGALAGTAGKEFADGTARAA